MIVDSEKKADSQVYRDDIKL